MNLEVVRKPLIDENFSERSFSINSDGSEEEDSYLGNMNQDPLNIFKLGKEKKSKEFSTMGTKSRELSIMQKSRVSSMRPSPKQSLWIK